MYVNLEERQSLLMKALQETPPKSFMESFLELTDWLANREQTLRTLTFVVVDVDVMDRQITQLKVLDKLDRGCVVILCCKDFTARDSRLDTL